MSDLLVGLMKQPLVLEAKPMVMEYSTGDQPTRHRGLQGIDLVINFRLEIIFSANPVWNVVVVHGGVGKW